MIGISGSLVSVDLLRTLALKPTGAIAASTHTALAHAFRTAGPASAARNVLDAVALPLVRALGFDVEVSKDSSVEILGVLLKGRQQSAHITVGAWGADLGRLSGIAANSPERPRWSIALNGAVLRIADRVRAYSRRILDFDLQRAYEDEESLAALVRIFETGDDGRLVTLERCAAESDAHRVAVGKSLQVGVEEALGHLIAALAPRRRRPPALDAALADALTIVYRILFLLFAEARGLVPQWHPIYRASYTIEALRPKIERSHRPPGVWPALQAISRLAHRGCHAGTLRVTPFNGRLFAPAEAPLAESATLDDRRIRDVLLAITTRPGRDRRERISYADLGVEQLGAVYERVLDFSPAVVDGSVVLARSGRRKATGTFYTPRSITDYLVRRTLAPLVRDQPPDAVLALRIVDPAMGSGAFLVAACRYLADAYEQALVRDGVVASVDVGPSERAAFRRTVAQQCLYGVDRNPTAVQLARLSLWLCTLAADRPLTFVDHRLRAGNSVVGAAPRDVMRQTPGTRPGMRRPGILPLFEEADLHQQLAASVVPRIAMASEADDSADVVRRKERTLAALEAQDAPLIVWRALSDAWCAAWFWPGGTERPSAQAWGSLSSALRGRPSGLPDSIERTWRDTIRSVSMRERFFHWELEFPEVFYDECGAPRTRAGFDAVLGNPPWDTLRGSTDAGDGTSSPAALTRFSRDSACYRFQGDGHANLYQLFTERALQLVRTGGRVGLLLPAGLFSDYGCVGLRQELLERSRLDLVLSFDNREAVFPIHRGVRFVLLTAEKGGTTTDVQAVFGLRSPAALEDLPDEGGVSGSTKLPVPLIRKFSGPGLALPELHSDLDRQIVTRILASTPALGSDDGWGCRFGRELNASDDRRHFGRRGLPVLEGKLLEPFHINVSRSTSRISPSMAARLLRGRAAFDRPRLGYREVAASTNRVTLIAAIVPADTVTTHTIFCLKGIVEPDLHWFLCGMLNSFVANYLVRLRGGTHVPASMMAHLPVPKPPRDSIAFTRVVSLARTLSSSTEAIDAYTELQARAAKLYGLTDAEFVHVLETFPLIASEVRRACADAVPAVMDAV